MIFSLEVFILYPVEFTCQLASSRPKNLSSMSAIFTFLNTPCYAVEAGVMQYFQIMENMASAEVDHHYPLSSIPQKSKEG